MSLTPGALLTLHIPASPHLSRLVWLGEQLQAYAGELAELSSHDGIAADLIAAEFDALRQAAAAARTAGGDVVLLATAAHHRVAVSASDVGVPDLPTGTAGDC